MASAGALEAVSFTLPAVLLPMEVAAVCGTEGLRRAVGRERAGRCK